MTICERLSDRMPAVARGEAGWTPDEEAHLEDCSECRAEWRLVLATGRLGADVAGAIDAHHVTERVLGRLRSARGQARERRWGFVIAGLAAAAAVALAVWTGPTRRVTPPIAARPVSPVVQDAALPLPELDTLGTPELQAVLETLDAPLGTTVPPTDAGELDGMNSQELQSMLDALEG